MSKTKCAYTSPLQMAHHDWLCATCQVLAAPHRASFPISPSRNRAPFQLLQVKPAQQAGISEGAGGTGRLSHWDTIYLGSFLEFGIACFINKQHVYYCQPFWTTVAADKQAVFAPLSFFINTMASQVLIPTSYLLVTTNIGKKRKAEFWVAAGMQKLRFG